MNHAVFIYSGLHYVHASFARSLNTDFYPLELLRHPNFPKKFFGIIPSLLFFPRKYNIYLCEGTFFFPSLLKKAGLVSKDKLIINLTGDPLVYFIYSNILKDIKRKVLINLLHEVNGFICIGKMEARLLTKIIGLKPHIVVYPFIKSDKYSQLGGISPNLKSHNILFIARGSDWFYKGLDLLINSFLIAKEEITDLKLSVVGRWQLKRKWLLEGINFVGYQPDLKSYIRNSSLYVHLGRGEAFGTSVLEAMLGGLPAIVSEWTGAKEVVQNLGSNFISKLDPQDAADKILKYFDMSLEKKMRLSKRAKTLAFPFNEEEKIGLFKKKFSELLEVLK